MLKWFSKGKTSESSIKNNPNQDNKGILEVSESSDLTDADYEFLFNQLLDGVAHGWNQLRIIKFFQNLGIRGEQSQWVAWLEKFSTKIPDGTNDSQRRLGAIMLRLAEVTQSAAELSQLSAISSQIGKKLFFGNLTNLIWEYDGLDRVFPTKPTIDNLPGENDNHNTEENMISFSQPMSESTVEKKTEPENTESFPVEEQVTSVPESRVEKSSEPEAKESSQTKAPATSISESRVEKSFEPEARESSQTNNQPETQESKSNSMIELVESWFNLGLKQANTGDLSGAIESWRKALEINPNLAEIWHNLGSALGRLEYYPEAIESFNHALQIDPQSYQAWNDRAHAFYQMQQWEQAITSWDQAISIEPVSHQFWYHRGCALEELKRLDEALVSYAKALEISPNFEPARSKYANLITKS